VAIRRPVKLDREEEIYCILGVSRCDSGGQPVFESTDLATVAHEFCHSWPLLRLSTAGRNGRTSGRRLFSTVADRMKRLAYGAWVTMINESIVRALWFVILRPPRGTKRPRGRCGGSRSRFLWMEGLSGLLGEYETQRSYPKFRAFMPRIVEFFDRTARQMAAEQKQ
jgi:hypothetical protein